MKRFFSILSFVLVAALISSSAFADSKIIPVGKSPARGAKRAQITIVAFENFQCPYTKKVQASLTELLKEKDVRVVSKVHPLPFHKNAKDASRAALAAQRFGKYWEMHDRLFEEQKEWKKLQPMKLKSYLIALAMSLGMDEDKFVTEFESKRVKDKIDADIALAAKVGSRGTPSFYINGVRLVGAQPVEKFMSVIEEERAELKKKKSNYARRVKANFNDPKPITSTSQKKPMVVQYVPLRADFPALGPKNAPVQIVVFGDYQCPFTKRLLPTISALQKQFGDDVRIEWRHLVLPFHKQAYEAAWGAEAAREQGKFWEMHDLLFETQAQFKTSGDMAAHVESLASKLKLDMKKFRSDYSSSKIRQREIDGANLAKEITARGTPNTFINGIKMTGAKPLSEFKAVITDQLAAAKKVRKKNKKAKGDKFYRAMIRYNDLEAAKQNRKLKDDQKK